jgi:hypothetical protein
MKRGGPQPKLTKAQEAALLADAEKAEADAADADEVGDGADMGAGDGAGVGGGGGEVEVVAVAEGEVGGTIDNPIMLPKRAAIRPAARSSCPRRRWRSEPPTCQLPTPPTCFGRIQGPL